MAILNKLTGAFPTAIVYITVGVLMTVWTSVWLVFHPGIPKDEYFWPVGLLISGIAILCIGLFLGSIGRAAKKAEMPPAEVTQAAANAEQLAASRAVIVPNNVIGGGNQVAPGGVAPGTPLPTNTAPLAPPGAAPIRL